MNEPLENPVNPRTSAFEQIDSLCREFRQEWKSGSSPSIETYLDRIDETAQPNLIRNLLHIEIEYRRRRKEQPSSNNYIQRFPHFAKLIREAFFESTMASLAVEEDTSQIKPTVSFQAPAANRLGDYLLINELGRGGFGVVYEAQHSQHGNRVALKTLPLGDGSQQLGEATRLHKFKREFRALADVNHPNLVGLHSLGCNRQPAGQQARLVGV